MNIFAEKLVTTIGHITTIKKQQIFVDFPGNEIPIAALSTVSLSPNSVHTKVLITFANNDKNSPVIIGVIQNNPIQKQNIQELDDKVLICGKQEVQICCGKSKIVLRESGKVTIQGENILSHAKKLNKIKGAGVKIN